jgi:hypothetical protein
MNEFSDDIIRAGARCLSGNCLPKVENHRNRESMIASLEEKIQAILAEARPQREQEVRSFAAKYGISDSTVPALMRFHLDHEW